MENQKISLEYAKLILPDINKLNLTQDEIKFVASYCLNGFKKEKAILSTNYKSLTTTKKRLIKAETLLKKEKINDAIKLYIVYILEPYKEKYNFQLLQTYSRRAFYDVTIFYDDEGYPYPIKYIKENFPEWVCVIDNYKRLPSQSIADEKRYEYTFANRDQALRQLNIILNGDEEESGKSGLSKESRDILEGIFSQPSPLEPELKTVEELEFEDGEIDDEE